MRRASPGCVLPRRCPNPSSSPCSVNYPQAVIVRRRPNEGAGGTGRAVSTNLLGSVIEGGESLAPKDLHRAFSRKRSWRNFPLQQLRSHQEKKLARALVKYGLDLRTVLPLQESFEMNRPVAGKIA